MALLKMWDGTQWVVAPSGAVVGIDDLSDVTLTSPANDDFLQRKSGVWVNRTPAQALVDLGAQPLDSDLTTIAAMSGADGSFIGRSGGAFALRSAALTKTDLSLNNVPNTKVNLTAIVGPTVSNDTTQGYSEGSIWVNTLTNIAYVCTDPGTGAALWRNIGFITSVSSPLVESGGGLTLPAAAGPSTNGYMLGTDKAKLDLLLANPVAHVRATHSVGVAIPNATATRLPFDTETVDVGGWHSNVTNNFNFVVPTTGYYGFDAWNDWAGSNVSERRIEVDLNGVAAARLACQAGSTGYASLVCSGKCNATAGDIFTVWVTQYTGVSLNTSQAYFHAWLIATPS